MVIFIDDLRHGPEGGSLILRKALNEVGGSTAKPLDLGQGRIGPTTLDRLQEVLKDSEQSRRFYDELARERTQKYPDESERFDYFRLKE